MTRLIDADALKNDLITFFPDKCLEGITTKTLFKQILTDIDNAPTVEENEKPFVTECRNTAIEKGLPLYFLYYEETGAFEVYKTDTKELFEKRHCVKHMKDYEFQQLASRYLDDYSNWIGGADMRGANNG